MSSERPAKRSGFLRLPGEIREAIYHEILDSKKNKYDLENYYSQYKFDLSILRVNHQIYHEARRVFRRDNIFIAIETPWPEAEEHASMDGHVPVVVKNDQAERFKDVYMTVQIDAPHYAMFSETKYKFVTLLEDLPTFTQMWRYQDLTHRGLNRHLRLTLKLKYPYGEDYEEKPIPKAIQKQLMEPFMQIKNLSEVSVQGEHYSSIEKSMREGMDAPPKSPEECLDECTVFKDQGNGAFEKGNYREAIRLYVEAFRAIHIICRGRQRQIWGDAYFQKDLAGGRYDKQDGLIVRLQLRVKLVANIVWSYLKLEEFEEARFWGMRTILMMREALDNEDFMPGFVAADAMGKIYYRTALAYKACGERDEARRLLKVAAQYLPNSRDVAKELTEVSPRLG